jgi:hypothetical protein
MLSDMGLFDKKKKGRDDFDSPVEQVDLSAPTTVELTADDDEEDDASVKAAAGSRPRPVTAVAAASPAPAPLRSPVTTYGIDDAIQLMRTLPQENVELVVRVVKHTLESTRIDIGTIINDATQKQERLSARVTVLKDAIADLEKEIQVRRKEIDELEADHRETTKVKERLVLAEKLTAPAAASAAPTEPASSTTTNRNLRASGTYTRAKPPTAPPPSAPPPPTSSTPPPSAVSTEVTGPMSTKK